MVTLNRPSQLLSEVHTLLLVLAGADVDLVAEARSIGRGNARRTVTGRGSGESTPYLPAS